MKKKIALILIFVGILVCIPNVMAVDVQGCKAALPNLSIDVKIANTVSTIITIIQIVVPILLVVFGMLDLAKAIVAAKEDEIKKGQKTLIKRLIVAAIVFFVIVLVKLLISFVADNSNNILDCFDCFINGADEKTGICETK